MIMKLQKKWLKASDPDEKAMGVEELSSTQSAMDEIEQELVILMLPKIPTMTKM